MDNDRIKAKLRKLLAMQERGTEGEAAAAASLTQSILDKYGLTLASIALDDEPKERTQSTDVEDIREGAEWRIRLWDTVGPHYDCLVLRRKGRSIASVSLVGRPSRAIQAQAYYEYFEERIEAEVKAYKKTDNYQDAIWEQVADMDSTKGHAAVAVLRSFRRAMINRLGHRLHSIRRAERQEGRPATPDTPETSALVVRQAHQALSDEIDAFHNSGEPGSRWSGGRARHSTASHSDIGAGAGSAAGERTSLNRQVNSNRPTRAIGS